MTDILFTHSYFYRFDEKQWRNRQPYPPYGTLYAAAVMRDLGFRVALFDTNLKKSAAEIAPVLAEKQPRYLVIYDDGFNYLTKMCLTKMREAAFELIRLGKKSGCVVLVCSSDSTDHFEKYLERGADFVMHGEGEITLRELVLKLEAGETEFAGLPGISFLNAEKRAVKNAPRAVETALDSLPDPAWDLVEMADYQSIWCENHSFFSLNMATTRGCPYKCNWCAKPIYGNRYHTRSPERVVSEIELLTKKYGADHFWMADDIFGLKPGWVQKFRDDLRRRGLKIRFKIQSRVDLLLKEDTIQALVEAGLEEVWVGAESGSQRILDAMDKGTEVAEIAEATRLLKKNGVRVCFFLQFGYLGETRDDINLTLEMVNDLMPDDIGVSVSYPLPGTGFYEKVRSQLGEKQNWADSNDLALLYEATFSQAFYRRLHRLVHHKFRKKQGLGEWRKLLRFQKADLRRAVRVLYYWPAEKWDAWRLGN